MSSIISKILDHVIIELCNSKLISSNLQFGFKNNCSTSQCTFAVNEIVQYYQNNGTDVYITLLDASKAFDRVNFNKLFDLLMSRNICPSICKLLVYMYINQKCYVKWGNDWSSPFTVSNGVKQGGVLSPILFNIYIDILLGRLRKSEIGCFIGNKFAGALGYADDIILLSPTLSGMMNLLKLCESFTKEYDIKFNTSKSQMLIANGDTTVRPIMFNDKEIPIVQSTKHLGHTIGKSYDKIQVDNDAIEDLYMRTNIILNKFRKCTIDVKYKLFEKCCMSIYGSMLWNFEDNYYKLN